MNKSVCSGGQKKIIDTKERMANVGGAMEKGGLGMYPATDGINRIAVAVIHPTYHFKNSPQQTSRPEDRDTSIADETILPVTAERYCSRGSHQGRGTGQGGEGLGPAHQNLITMFKIKEEADSFTRNPDG
jgi:hypothetical protein